MPKTFRPYEPDQLLLMPPSLADWVPEDHLARFVADVVASLDLRALEEAYTEERGYPPYHPRMMVTLLLYAYCTGVYSSRKLGRVAIDGTKIKANASKHKAMSYGRMKQEEARLRQEVAELLRRAEAADREEDERYGP